MGPRVYECSRVPCNTTLCMSVSKALAVLIELRTGTGSEHATHKPQAHELCPTYGLFLLRLSSSTRETKVVLLCPGSRVTDICQRWSGRDASRYPGSDQGGRSESVRK